MEVSYVILIFLFLRGSPAWIEHLVSPSISWMFFSSIFICLWVLYMFYDLFWANRSINYMIDNRFNNISQIENEDAEQAADGDAEPAP